MSKIYRTSVSDAGLTAMIRRLGRECRPLQFVREFVQNSIEAVQRTGEPGRILIDVNWDFMDIGLTDTFKISFTDTGVGMIGEEIGEYINKLSSSGGENIFENYGIGAKISSITRNECGVVYESWVDGLGCQAVYQYDIDEDVFGLRQFNQGDGTYRYFQMLADEYMPRLINDHNGEHGTRVTLLGNSMDQDTMGIPDGTQGTRESWIYRAINVRYFEIPNDVDIQVRIGYNRSRENTKHNYLRKVTGQKSVLEKYAVSSGFVQLSDAMVHWWILDRKRQGHGRNAVSGHTACLNQCELFDRSFGRTNKAIDFGIIFGARDVVLYVQPDGDYVQNTTRTGLVKVDGNPLPWERWADEFRGLMPDALKRHVEDIMIATVNDSHEKSIRERLNKLKDFYRISRYRSNSLGGFEMDEDTVVESETGREGVTGSGGDGGPGSNPGSFPELLSTLRKAGGARSDELNPNPFPRLDWVSTTNNTREPGEIEDRAARFIERDNLIKANKDYQGFRDVLDYFIKRYQHIPGASEAIADPVYEQFEQLLIETVAGAMSLKGREHWSPDDFETAVSDEALTAAVMTRYHIVKAINQSLRSRLGKPELQAA